jgi:hypothetical protein
MHPTISSPTSSSGQSSHIQATVKCVLTSCRTLPIIFLLNLTTMNRRRRLELVGIFSIGFLAIVASAIRLRVILLWLTDFIHQGENTSNLMIWSQVEQNIGMIAGSIPFLRPLFRKALLHVRSRSKTPEIQLIGDGALPDHQHFVPRELIIPSPSPTFEREGEFKMPDVELPPIQSFKSGTSWGSAIWDGSQVRQVLPT